MSEVTFSLLDRDGDEILTEDEFSSLQTEGDGEKEGETLTQGEDERRKEFRDVIDKNHDGKADRKELLVTKKHSSFSTYHYFVVVNTFFVNLTSYNFSLRTFHTC